MRTARIIAIILTVGMVYSVGARGIGADDPAGSSASPYAWAGVFHLKAGNYIVQFNIVGAEAAGEAPADVARMTLLATDSRLLRGITAKEAAASELFRSDPIIGPGGKGLVIVPGDLFYELKLEYLRCPTQYRVEIEREGNYVVFLDRKPKEYIGSGNFFADLEGGVIRPSSQKVY